MTDMRGPALLGTVKADRARIGVRMAAATLVTAILVALSTLPIPAAPPLGPFLDPVRGVWALASRALPPERLTHGLVGLSHPVQVVVDDRGVPHVFAASEEDAYRVLGWLVARDRLFQLELQSRSAEGTLTELLGKRALEADRATRALGLPWAAQRKWAALDPASLAHRAILAYAEGVNAWIAGLDRRDLPFEYRLLGAWPRRWEPVHTLLLFLQMGRTLASYDPARDRLAMAALVGVEAAEALVPVNSPIQEPIVPAPLVRRPPPPRAPVPPPGEPDPEARALLTAYDPFDSPRASRGVTVGSNNWAVAPARTRDGHAILAGDPHLELTLPSVWYEAHLVVPGRLDVAGVTLPGAPGVVIGFNRDIAWSFTNTGADVLDLYRETVDTPEQPTRYLLDGEWRVLQLREEAYRDRKGRLLAVDTLRFTHRGPMRRTEAGWVSARWTVLEPSAEVDVFLRAARASSVAMWLDVMRDYGAPIQNGLVADRSGAIAIRSSGRYPVRPGSGRGDLVFDGSSRAADWRGFLPVERYPFALNPQQEFLASANQQPVDPAVDPTYLGANWPAPFRAIRINSLLRGDSAVTPEAMRRMQTDPGSARADSLVPWFLHAAAAMEAAGASDPTLSRARALLAEWDRRYTPDNRRAILFELAMRDLVRRLFDELLSPDRDRLPFFPTSVAVLRLLHDPDNPWWDHRDTPDRIEGRDEVVAASLRAALETAIHRYGDPDAPGSRWRWGEVWPTEIRHLLGLDALSALAVPVQGGPETIAPAGQHGSHGPSWRMVVELGPEIRAWGTYPGGQSGNPASHWYADRVGEWSRGELAPLLFPRSPDAIPARRVRSRFTFVPR
jgi:penicillin amidase